MHKDASPDLEQCGHPDGVPFRTTKNEQRAHKKIEVLCSVQWHDVRTRFHEKLSLGPGVL